MTEYNDDNVRALLRKEMRRQRLSAYELAKRSGVSGMTIGYYLRGKVGLISTSLFALFRALGISVDDDEVRARVQTERDARGLTNYTLAKRAGINRTSLGYYLQGRSRGLRTDKLYPLLRVLGITLPNPAE